MPPKLLHTRAALPPPTRAKPEGPYEWFTLVTPAIDSHRTIVRPEGVRTERFKTNPVFLWMHHSSGSCLGDPPGPEAILGRVEKWEQDEERFDIMPLFDVEDPFVRDVYGKVSRKFLRATSLGFWPLKEHTEKIGDEEIVVYDEVELVEASLVIVGSNPEALLRGLAGERRESGAKRAAWAYVRNLGIDEGKSALLAALSDGVGAPLAGLAIDVVEGLRGVQQAQGNVLDRLSALERAQKERRTMEPTTEPTREGPAAESGKGSMVVPMETRMAYRMMLGRAMDGAEQHMVHAAMMPEQHMGMHREMATQDMDEADRMMRMMRDITIAQVEGDEEEEMEGEMRSAPAGAPADLAARYEKLARQAHGHIPRRLADVVTRELGTASPSKVKLRLARLQQDAELAEEAAARVRGDALRAQAELLNREVEEALRGKWITPATASKARGIDPATSKPLPGGPWTIAELRSFVADQKQRGPVIGTKDLAPAPPEARPTELTEAEKRNPEPDAPQELDLTARLKRANGWS